MMGDFKTPIYVGWEEVSVSSEKGNREVRYFLKRADAKEDLVIVGKEKSLRHMSYRYVMKGLSNCDVKLKSRRDVVDWIHTIVSGNQSSGSLGPFVGDMEGKLDMYSCKDVEMENQGTWKNDFRWLGSPWTCRKKRVHYKSFCRNSVIISVHDFVYVLAEEKKRLVAYLDDLYEDIRGNKMVVVRWFHKIDEVGFTLPTNNSDTEIFFSLCLQDLSIECIDGLATILSPEHYEKYLSEATRLGLSPFICSKLFDNDEVKPFDITTIKGYWKQKVLRKPLSLLSELSDDDLMVRGSISDAVVLRPKKRIRCEPFTKSVDKSISLYNTKEGIGVQTDKEVCPTVFSPVQDDISSSHLVQCLTIGSQVEVLCQDSGIRGCWFRGLIVKRIKNKVKVRYQDLRDSIDDTKYLEEWISAFRVALPDGLGVRVQGRTMVRPCPSSDKVRASCELNIGSIVDAWWYDGWWEGIVVKKESDDRLIVYFPGEKQEMIFRSSDLRHSMEWVDDSWQILKERPELVTMLCGLENDIERNKNSDSNRKPCDLNAGKDSTFQKSPRNVIKIRIPKNDDGKIPRVSVISDVVKDDLLARLTWKSSGKKRSCRRPIQKLRNSPFHGTESSVKLYVNTEKCKYASDPHFSSSTARNLTNLVMSR